MTIDPLRGDRLQPGWFMYIASSPAVRVWSGVANFKLGAGSGPDVDGGIYAGLGILVGVPKLTIPSNGAFAAHTFSLSGVTPQMMKLANADRDAIRGARISFGRVELDGDLNPIGAVSWVWVGWIDSPRIVRDGSTSPPTRTVSIVCATGAYRRNVRKYAYWTPPQQGAIDPADTSCNNVPTYAAGTGIIWPS